MRQIPLSIANSCPHQKVQGIRLIFRKTDTLAIISSVCSGKKVCCSEKFGDRCLVERIITLEEARALREMGEAGLINCR